jgi:hypothetical protein
MLVETTTTGSSSPSEFHKERVSLYRNHTRFTLGASGFVKFFNEFAYEFFKVLQIILPKNFNAKKAYFYSDLGDNCIRTAKQGRIQKIIKFKTTPGFLKKARGS